MEIIIYCSKCGERTPHRDDSIKISEYESVLAWRCNLCDGVQRNTLKLSYTKNQDNDKENSNNERG